MIHTSLIKTKDINCYNKTKKKSKYYSRIALA